MTIQQHASFDSSAAELNATSKLVKAWESKNAKNAAKAGGVSLMALSLAACGGSDSTTTAVVADPVTPVAQTLTLTAGIDSVTGTAGDDTINAGLNTNSTQTLQGLDTVDGGAGTDTMNVVFNTAGNYAPSLSNIEVVNLTTSANITVDAVGVTGATTIKSTGSTGTVAINNIASPAASITIQSTAVDHDLDYANSAVTGTADTATVTISGMTAGTLTVDAGIESLGLVSGGSANTVALTATGANTLTLTGAQDMTLSTANTVAETINAAAATGKVTVTTDNVNDTTVTGGSGNDSITSTGGTATTVTINAGAGDDTITHTAALTTADVIDGGEGTDTLVSTTAQLKALTINATTAKITNIEAITVTDEYDDTTNAIDTSGLIQATGIQTVTLKAASTTAGEDITTGDEVITMSAGANTLNLGSSLAGNQSHLGGVLTVNDTGTAATDSIVVNNKSLNSTTGANVDIGNLAGPTTNGFVFGGYESVTFDTGQGSGSIEQNVLTLDINPDTATTDVSLTLTGKNGIDIATDVTTTSTGKLTIDASGMTAQATGTTTFDINSTVQGTAGTLEITGSGGDDIIVSGAFAATLSGGAGADNITGSAKNDTINGGAGKDTLVALGGTDTINGGDGDDTLTLTTAGTYTVSGGAGVDKADFGGTLTQADSFDGGDGIDVLIVNNTSVTAVNALAVSNVNTLNANLVSVEKVDFGTTLAQSIDMGRFDNISSVIIGGMAGDSTISGLLATNNIEISASTGQATTLTLADATGTADVVNVNLSGTNLVAAGTVTAANVETVNIKGSDQAAADVATINTMILVATKATSVVVTGSDGLTLTNTGNTKITSFDASGVAATNASDTAANMAVAFASANTSTVAAVSIKGGAGEDTLTGNNSIDTISGGAGDDTLVASSGNDVYSGDAGNDTVSFTKTLLAANSGTTATFDGGAGTDIILISDTAATIVDADFRGMSSFETFTTNNGTNSITLAVDADGVGIKTINGGTGADTINASDIDFDNALTVTAAAGADSVQLNAANGVVDTIVIGKGDGVASTASSITATRAAADTITLATDVITGFGTTAGALDLLDVATAGSLGTALIGGTEATALVDDITFYSYGTYNTGTGVFTLQAAHSATNNDLLIGVGDGVLLADTLDGFTVITDLDNALTTAQLI